MIGEAKQYIETVDVFAWTLTVILLSLAIEFVFAALINRLGTRRPRRLQKEAAYAERT
jgi:ABC-type nitrate/sulfonate/bicarbonate transport system permease component